MVRVTSLSLAAVLLVLAAECTAQFILPTYRPPITTRPIYRIRRDADEPLWLNQGEDVPRAPATGDHPYLPSYIDDIKLDPNTRVARSVDSPSARRAGARSTPASRDTGATHPGYNRRNTRSVHMLPHDPLRPETFPRPPSPFNPRPVGKPILIAGRGKRDIQFPHKPKHQVLVIPGWNPNAKVQPWQKIKIRN